MPIKWLAWVLSSIVADPDPCQHAECCDGCKMSSADSLTLKMTLAYVVPQADVALGELMDALERYEQTLQQAEGRAGDGNML